MLAEDAPVSDFDQALPITLKFEGGWANNPRDPGGQTMKGVTQRVYDAYRAAHGLEPQTVHDISDDELRDIYYANYWQPAGCDNFPWPLDLAVFDFAVNSGVARAVMELQRVIGIKADGKFGPQTRQAVLDAVTQTGAADLAFRLDGARRTFLNLIVDQHPNLSEFLSGWMKRVDQLDSIVSQPTGA